MDSSNTHAQERRITFRPNGDANSFALLDDEGNWWLNLLMNGEMTTQRQEANMRRIAACWNACADMPTDVLELAGDGQSPDVREWFDTWGDAHLYAPGGDVRSLADERDRLQAEVARLRAELAATPAASAPTLESMAREATLEQHPELRDDLTGTAGMAQDAARYRLLRVRGAAFAGDANRHLENGLVYRIGNLDEAIDALRAVPSRS